MRRQDLQRFVATGLLLATAKAQATPPKPIKKRALNTVFTTHDYDVRILSDGCEVKLVSPMIDPNAKTTAWKINYDRNSASSEPITPLVTPDTESVDRLFSTPEAMEAIKDLEDGARRSTEAFRICEDKINNNAPVGSFFTGGDYVVTKDKDGSYEFSRISYELIRNEDLLGPSIATVTMKAGKVVEVAIDSDDSDAFRKGIGYFKAQAQALSAADLTGHGSRLPSGTTWKGTLLRVTR
jgi:hypothetical protein